MQNKLKVYRAIKDITQEELAQAIGLSRQSIHSIESGKYVPSTLLALRMADYFGVPVEALFQLDPEEKVE